MSFVGLAHEGRSRYVLIASDTHPENGVALEAPQDENPAQARADFVEELGLEATSSSRSAKARTGSSAGTSPSRFASAGMRAERVGSVYAAIACCAARSSSGR